MQPFSGGTGWQWVGAAVCRGNSGPEQFGVKMVTRTQNIVRLVWTRLVQSLVSLWLITVLFFLITELAPNDYAILSTRGASASQLDYIRFELGLYDAAPVRYLEWLLGVLSGDLGISWWANRPIAPLIADRLWHSAWLFGWSAMIMLPLAMAFATFAVVWRDGIFDRISARLSIALISLPEFAVAYALLILLTLYLDIFPSYTLYALEMPLFERLYASGLPILSLAAVTITPMFRLSRSALLNTLGNEYIQMAELKGVGRWRLVLRHTLPNAVGPIANAIALSLANLFFGLVIVEMIFAYPGLGSLLYTAATYRDIPLVLACGLISAVIIIGLTSMADMVSLMANPRLRDATNTTVGRRKRPDISWSRTLSLLQSMSPLKRAMIGLLALTGAATVWSSLAMDHINHVDIVTTPRPSGDVRLKITVGALQGKSPDLATPVHYEYFMPLGPAQNAKHVFQGQLNVPHFKVLQRTIRAPIRDSHMMLPALALNFVSHGNVLLPINGDRLLELDENWFIIVSAGRTWHEPGDGNWSRASFPFTLVGRSGLGPHYGVATFLFNSQKVSQFRFQVAQETANWAQYDLWAQTPMTYQPGEFTNTQQVRDDYDLMIASRVTMRPWDDLTTQYWRSLEIFDGEGNRENISASGLMIDDVFYLRPCRTRAGPHPYCREMRHGVYSITKTLGAGVSMLWLAQRYGPQVFDEKITDYVTIPADHHGWDDVTFGNTLDMVTGIGNVVPERVDYYVEADSTSTSRMIWVADSIQDKLNAVARYRDYPWKPGEVFRYRTSDTTTLSAAMEAYLRVKEGPDADLWDSLTREVFAPLGIIRMPVRRTLEPDGRPGTPLFGYGLYATIDESLKVARLLQNHGEFEGIQLLHRELTKQAVSTDMERGYPNGWRGKGRAEGHYKTSFWLTPHEQTFSCDLRIPVMAGFRGNYIIIMPNGTIGLRFADGHDENPDTWDSNGIRDVSNRIRPFCD